MIVQICYGFKLLLKVATDKVFPKRFYKCNTRTNKEVYKPLRKESINGVRSTILHISTKQTIISDLKSLNIKSRHGEKGQTNDIVKVNKSENASYLVLE